MKTGLAAASYVMRHRYVWPGGYALALVIDNGDLLCSDCIREGFENIAWSWINRVHDGWFPMSLAVLDDPGWEPVCANCARKI